MNQLLGESPTAAMVRLAILALAAVLFSFLYLIFQFKGLNSSEAMDQAQLARNISQGKGYVTENIRPLALWVAQKNNPDAKPDLEAVTDTVNPPAYPYLLAAWLKIYGPKYEIPLIKGEFEMFDGDMAAAVLSCIWFGLGLLALYAWVAQMIDPKAATVVCALALFSDYLWQWAISGTSWSLLFLLTVLMGWLVFLRIRSGGRGAAAWISALALGVILAVGFLSRYSYLLWLLPVLLAVLIHGQRGRFRDAAIIAAVAMVIIAPWCTRNLALTGSPFGVASYGVFGGMDPYPGATILNSYDPDFAEATVKRMGKKWMTYARQAWETDIKAVGANWMVCFFVVSCFYVFRREDLQRVKWFAVYALLSFIAVLPLIWLPSMHGVSTQNLYSLLTPFILIFGGVFFLVLLDRWELHSGFLKNLVLALFVGINSFGFFYALTVNPPPFRYPPYYPPLIAQAAAFVKTEPVSIAGSEKKMREWMMSDMPWAMAWYGKRPTVGLTYKMDEFLKIHDNLKEFAAVFLTPISAHRDLIETLYNGELKEWMPIIVFHQVPDIFPLKGGMPMGPDFVLLTDPARLQKFEKMPE